MKQPLGRRQTTEDTGEDIIQETLGKSDDDFERYSRN